MKIDSNGTAVEDTPVETPIEQPADALEAEVIVDPTETPADPVVVDEPADEPDAPADEPTVDEPAPDAPEPVTFDASEELPVLLEKTGEVFDQYDLPQDVQAAIEVLRTKAENAPQDIIGEYSVFGDTEEVKSLLERESMLFNERIDDNGTRRPKTDEYAQDLITKKPEVASWLHYDLSKSPSTRYEGRNKFQELVVDALALPTDTVNSVLERYDRFVNYMKAGALPASNVPSFIPENLHSAFMSLSVEEREELAAYEPATDRIEYDDDNKPKNLDAPVRERKLATLAQIQKGIDADQKENQLIAYTNRQNDIAFNNDVQSRQIAFFDTFRETFTKDLMEKVIFSDDPKIQTMLAHQNVTLLSQAFDDGSTGEYARKALETAGIPFDNNKAQQLLKDVETASVALVSAQRAVDPQTKEPLDKLALNKATKEFKDAGTKWQEFGKETLDKLALLTSTGTAEAIEKAVEKKKIAPKARAAVKGVSTPATKQDTIPAYKSKEWYDRIVNQELAVEAKKAAAFQ